MAAWLIVAGIAVTIGAASMIYLIMDPVFFDLTNRAMNMTANATAEQSIGYTQTIWKWLPLVMLLSLLVYGIIRAILETKRGGGL